jgi:hypothetical protein
MQINCMQKHNKAVLLLSSVIFCLGVIYFVRTSPEGGEKPDSKKTSSLKEVQPPRNTQAADLSSLPMPNTPKQEGSVPAMRAVSAGGWRGEQIEWLDEAGAAPIKLSTIQKSAKVLIRRQMDGAPIKSRAEAAAHLDIHISMAMRPNVAFENDQHFFFSGGTTAYPVTDFSKGLAVKKANGEITSW